jgi:Trk K+ transport system NAD-binding subunit
MPRITIAGLGFVGTANALVLARHNAVTAYDIDPARVAERRRAMGTRVVIHEPSVTHHSLWAAKYLRTWHGSSC